ncbi:MAG TPA: GNAT family N-acetyltransferase [Burkholderiaceae bacterium]|nr:GNAT family N-acetyltransferase [Burkholderiaceae bacterium]
MDGSTRAAVSYHGAQHASDYRLARSLFEEYAGQLGIDLCFQDFATELETLPAMYGAPDGALIIARDREPLGCVAVRRLDASRCEMKRLYVRAVARGRGIGRALALEAIACGRALGYRSMALDTLRSMHAARQLYESLGFRPIPKYNDNPLADAMFFGREL